MAPAMPDHTTNSQTDITSDTKPDSSCAQRRRSALAEPAALTTQHHILFQSVTLVSIWR
jgi:hypothetical protein